MQKIEAKEHFIRYLSWQINSVSSANLYPQTVCYESFAAMADPMLEMEAEHNVLGALEELGERYLYGLGYSMNIDKAVELLGKAAGEGHPDAYGVLSNIYKNDNYGRKNLERYFDLLQKGAERGSWMTMFNLSCAYYKGKEQYEGHGVEQNKVLALDWCMSAAEMVMEVMDVMFAMCCSKGFKEYIDNLYRTFVLSVNSAAEQLIEGDGLSKETELAKKFLLESIRFHKQITGDTRQDFEQLLRKCN